MRKKKEKKKRVKGGDGKQRWRGWAKKDNRLTKHGLQIPEARSRKGGQKPMT